MDISKSTDDSIPKKASEDEQRAATEGEQKATEEEQDISKPTETGDDSVPEKDGTDLTKSSL